jgi:hypothetical protein
MQWELLTSNKEESFLILLTGLGGVIYPPHSLHADVLKEELFMKLSPYGDDLWFWAMAVIKGTKVKVIEKNILNFISIDGSQDVGLWNQINKAGHNDVQLNNLLCHYPELDAIIDGWNKNPLKRVWRWMRGWYPYKKTI